MLRYLASVGINLNSRVRVLVRCEFTEIILGGDRISKGRGNHRRTRQPSSLGDLGGGLAGDHERSEARRSGSPSDNSAAITLSDRLAARR